MIEQKKLYCKPEMTVVEMEYETSLLDNSRIIPIDWDDTESKEE